jgi:hypothetical protein
MTTKAAVIGALAVGLCAVNVSDVHACGCFTPPDPSVPIVQAGERILFAMANGQVTAHIQIQYQGTASDFGWLLPLPSVPTLELGTDELFTQLTNQTQPKYEVNNVYDGNCFGGGAFGSGGATVPGVAQGPGNSTGGDNGGGNVLVYQNSVGPYDYAVLHADSQTDMLNWLNTNHYFVPTGTADAVSAYIHPGAFFLALKLKSGNTTGNLQPVVVHYASDLPMIPIVLTSVAANPHMGIQVWMLGPGRAIPRNYYHTVINDAKLDWLNAARNYNDVIIAATAEAPGKHSFVTEYAGTATIMHDVLLPPGRFGDQATLAAQATDIAFLQYVVGSNFPFTSATLGVLGQYIPMPAGLASMGVTPTQFYSEASYYLSASFKAQNPQIFAGWTENFQPTMMASDLFTRVVMPTQAANALFDLYPSLTRLYTTLSPADMNKDPVFSFNPGLPGYSNVHTGTVTFFCGYTGAYNPSNAPAQLRTEEGWVIDYPKGTGVTFVTPGGPASQRIEVLHEEGAPLVIADNQSAISNALGSGGCGVGFGGRATRDLAGVLLLGLVVGALILRRRRA